MNERPREVPALPGPAFAACACVLLASWPVLRWFVARLGDGGDERFGLAALALAIALTPRTLWREHVAPWRPVLAGALVLCAAIPLGFPMLVRALMTVAACAVFVCRGPGALGRAGLLALALPVTATLQFFTGYPLRVLTAELGRPLIALFGVTTERIGVALHWAGGLVIVDAPCSGVHMLWTGGVFTCALAAWLRLDAWRTLALGGMGLAGILLGNVVRAAVLFFVESGLWRAPRWAHEGVGLGIFAALAACLLWLGFKLVKSSGREDTSGNCNPLGYNMGASPEVLEKPVCNPMGYKHFFTLLCICAIAAALPFTGGHANTVSPKQIFPGWPEMFEGKPWIRLARPDGAAAFAPGFAGQAAMFRQGDGDESRLVVLRWISEASRGAHPAADCFRACGYSVKIGGLTRDPSGVLWAEFFAERGGETWRVRERWHDEHGGAWTDVSAWYWAAARDGASGPWWAVTVAERCGESS